MMIKNFTRLLAIIIATSASAQNVAINSTGTPPHPTAILDLSANDKGILIPRMTTTDREAILNPADGLIVFDTDARGLWFYSSGWKKFVSGSDMGDAGGDLTGQYPEPVVAGLQGHTVSGLTPQDKQVLKWDMTEDMWKGMNDSLTLPFVASHADPNPLFSVTNSFNGFSMNNLAILGRRHIASGIGLTFPAAIWGDAYIGTGLLGTSNTHEGVFGKSQQNHGVHGQSLGGNGFAGVYGSQGNSGIIPGTTMGVWGDNADGLGVVGTSNSGVGVYGVSFNNHGVYGYATHTNWAGIKGSHANDGGIAVQGEVSKGTGVLGNVQIEGTGVYGTVFNGTGVLGDVQNAGTGVYGKATGAQGTAGKFSSTSALHSDTTLVVNSNGTGNLAHFHVTNADNSQPGINIYHEGAGDGLAVVLSKNNSNAKAVNAFANGIGTAVYGRSEFGVAGKFEILNIGSMSTAVMINNQGLGAGLDILSPRGSGASIVLSNATASGRALNIGNHGTGVTAMFKNHNPLSDSTVVYVQQSGLGHGISVIVGNDESETAAVSVVSAADWGVSSTVFGKHAIQGTSFADFGLAVEGQTFGDYGVGVSGISNASTNGIGVSGVASDMDPFGYGVRGVGNYAGVYAEAKGENGTGIWARTGNTGKNSSAAQFQNLYSNNTDNVVEIYSNGIGNQLYMSNDNQSNSAPFIHIRNGGTGPFLNFVNSANDVKTSISSSGNITTEGTIKVRNNMGIVRNSSSTQLRVETVSAVFNASGPYETLTPLEYREINVTFATPFLSAPAVYIANITQDGGARYMMANVKDVTTTGCVLYFINPMSQNIAVGDSTWKLVAMGQE